MLRKGLLIHSWKRFTNLNPHIFSNKRMEGQMEESSEWGVKVEGVQVLVILGSNAKMGKLSIEEGIVSLGSVEI